jgi:Winged helix DNA-binding domain
MSPLRLRSDSVPSLSHADRPAPLTPAASAAPAGSASPAATVTSPSPLSSTEAVAISRKGGVPAMLRRVGGVQLDTISVLARSHELVAYARLGPVSRDRIERAYWNPAHPSAFEYWAHAACVLPI